MCLVAHYRKNLFRRQTQTYGLWLKLQVIVLSRVCNCEKSVSLVASPSYGKFKSIATISSQSQLFQFAAKMFSQLMRKTFFNP